MFSYTLREHKLVSHFPGQRNKRLLITLPSETVCFTQSFSMSEFRPVFLVYGGGDIWQPGDSLGVAPSVTLLIKDISQLMVLSLPLDSLQLNPELIHLHETAIAAYDCNSLRSCSP
jgi:hypothetical protein